MHEDIFAAIVADNEAEALLTVEEFYDTRAFANDLCRHRCTRCSASAATKSAAAAAAEAIATTAAEAITAAATETVTASGISTEIVVAEAIALVPAASRKKSR